MRGSPKEIATVIKRIPGKVATELRQAEIANLDHAEKLAEAMSQGPYKQKQLTAMGHPYAKARPNPPLRPGIINIQTGKFFRSWRRRVGSWSGGTLKSRIGNISPEAKYMTGTKYMIRRPIEVMLRRFLKNDRMTRLRNALRRGLRP